MPNTIQGVIPPTNACRFSQGVRCPLPVCQARHDEWDEFVQEQTMEDDGCPLEGPVELRQPWRPPCPYPGTQTGGHKQGRS